MGVEVPLNTSWYWDALGTWTVMSPVKGLPGKIWVTSPSGSFGVGGYPNSELLLVSPVREKSFQLYSL
ncbi:MAG TPA: hypothetical protein DD856_14465 [Sulfobacillus sp.]|nr:hypothetical protein [Sulfobacillus sp.]